MRWQSQSRLKAAVGLALSILLVGCAAAPAAVATQPPTATLAPATPTHFPVPIHILTEVAKLDPQRFQLVYTAEGWALLTAAGKVVMRAGSQPGTISIVVKGGEGQSYPAGSYEVIWPLAATPTP